MNIFVEAKSLFSLGQTVLLDVTDKGIPPVPPNFPTCPIHTKEDVSDNRLVKLNTIGNDYSSAIGYNPHVFIFIFIFVTRYATSL